VPEEGAGAVAAAAGAVCGWFVCCATPAMAKAKLEQTVSRIENFRFIGCGLSNWSHTVSRSPCPGHLAARLQRADPISCSSTPRDRIAIGPRSNTRPRRMAAASSGAVRGSELVEGAHESLKRRF